MGDVAAARAVRFSIAPKAAPMAVVPMSLLQVCQLRGAAGAGRTVR